MKPLEYIQLDIGLRDSPEFMLFWSELGGEELEALGAFASLLMWAGRHCPRDGHVGRFDERIIGRACGFPVGKDVLKAMRSAGLLVDGVITGWVKRYAPVFAKRDRDRARKAEKDAVAGGSVGNQQLSAGKDTDFRATGAQLNPTKTNTPPNPLAGEGEVGCADEEEPGFAAFWNAYPAGTRIGFKVNKDACRIRWFCDGLEQDADYILRALEICKQKSDWKNPQPLKWLKEACWVNLKDAEKRRNEAAKPRDKPDPTRNPTATGNGPQRANGSDGRPADDPEAVARRIEAEERVRKQLNWMKPKGKDGSNASQAVQETCSK